MLRIISRMQSANNNIKSKTLKWQARKQTLLVVCESHTMSLPSWEADTRYLQYSTRKYTHCVSGNAATTRTTIIKITREVCEIKSQRTSNRCPSAWRRSSRGGRAACAACASARAAQVRHCRWVSWAPHQPLPCEPPVRTEQKGVLQTRSPRLPFELRTYAYLVLELLGFLTQLV